MKQLYSYYPEFDKDDCLLWHVVEDPTQQIIQSFLFEDDAEDYCGFLEKGGAFAGFTPSFILKKANFGNINDAFDAEFAE